MALKARYGRHRDASHGFSPASRTDPFEILAAEHALLRQQFARVLEAARGSPRGGVEGSALAALGESLRLHQQREEGALYPICEQLFGGKDGVSAVLREGHLVLLAQIADLARHPGHGTARRVARMESLRRLAEDHFAQEERVLFPMMAALLSGTETATLARRLRAIPAT